MNKGLHVHTGQRYIPRLLEYWQNGKVDPSFVFAHRLSLNDATKAHPMFRDFGSTHPELLPRHVRFSHIHIGSILDGWM
jgi:threonine dehydrogenase-like Zn-dependent dehydrogenase